MPVQAATALDILLVDDDRPLREMLTRSFEREGHRVTAVPDGDTALHAASERSFDVVLLDVALGAGPTGYDVARMLRSRRDVVPIIMLTALDSEADAVQGLEAGADDYVTKPFSPRELVLRVDALLRRVGEKSRPEIGSVVDGDLVVDSGRHEATLDGRPLALTTREFDLLRFLVTNPGTAYSRDELLQQVWGWSFGDQSTVTVHVRRLREKVEVDPKRPSRLVTVWGVGYRWEPAA